MTADHFHPPSPYSIEAKQLPPLAVEPAAADGEAGAPPRPAFLAARDVAAGEAVLAVPGDLAVTSVDVGKDAGLAALAEGRSELVGLALWLMQERAKVRGAGRGGLVVCLLSKVQLLGSAAEG